MEGREAMTLPGTCSYYLHRGVGGSGSGVQSGGLHSPPQFRHLLKPGSTGQASGHSSSIEPALPSVPSQAIFSHGFGRGVTSELQSGEPVRKKRGRPRKYDNDRPMSLALSPMSANPTPGSLTPTLKRGRGRPPGSGRKQQLAAVGEWMSSSAGLAFAPHVISVAPGENIASKLLLFSQQRPRAVCILSGTGRVSAVTLHQPASSSDGVTYEGQFEIICLSGSYLVAEDGGPRKRDGGINVSLSSPDGQVIGGSVGGVLIAAGPVQVVACSFVYGGSKARNKLGALGAENSGLKPKASAAPTNVASSQDLLPSTGTGFCPSSQVVDLKNPHLDTHLTRQ